MRNLLLMLAALLIAVWLAGRLLSLLYRAGNLLLLVAVVLILVAVITRRD
ncbi:MAG: hypothetical protein M3Q29_01520 [Chloroflexota bacterium]|nr:hypothetical protein [Chloroflexota bacterium]